MRRLLLLAGFVYAMSSTAAEPDYAELDALMAPLNDPKYQSIAAFQIFEDLYYVGMHWVAAYVLVTSEGLIVIDALYEDWVEHIVRGIEQVGLDPNDIKYVLCTHGHFDHAGGAKVLQERYGAKVVMTAEDVELAKASQGHPTLHFEMADYEIAEDGDVIALGDKRVTLSKTPGHTWGAMSMQFQVHDGDEGYTVMTLGGVGLNFSGVKQTETYIASYKRLISIQDEIDVGLSNHPFMTGLFERRDQLAERKDGEPHPFVDADVYQAQLAQLLVNAEKKLALERAGNAPGTVETLKKMFGALTEEYEKQE